MQFIKSDVSIFRFATSRATIAIATARVLILFWYLRSGDLRDFGQIDISVGSLGREQSRKSSCFYRWNDCVRHSSVQRCIANDTNIDSALIIAGSCTANFLTRSKYRRHRTVETRVQICHEFLSETLNTLRWRCSINKIARFDRLEFMDIQVTVEFVPSEITHWPEYKNVRISSVEKTDVQWELSSSAQRNITEDCDRERRWIIGDKNFVASEFSRRWDNQLLSQFVQQFYLWCIVR